MICGLCEGMGSLICTQNSYEGRIEPKTKKWVHDSTHREWHDCPACGGSGVRVQTGPAMIRLRRPKRNQHNA